MTARIKINLSRTEYEVISEVSRSLNWACVQNEEDTDCDVIWIDCALLPSELSMLKPFQRINHLPGMYAIAQKHHLGKHFKYMSSLFPNDYDFFPSTWVLPKDLNDLKLNFSKANTYIVKPEALSQGQGIFLTKKLDHMQDHCVVQQYIPNPLLLEGLKFDLRVYLLITASDPMRLYIHKDGLVRLATEQYSQPCAANLDNLFMHLTNYAINKTSPVFEYNSDLTESFKGHKRSLRKFLEVLLEQGYDSAHLWQQICEVSVKTMCMIQPLLSHLYRSSQPNDPCNQICFQILGLDILLDENMKPYVLEVNHTPSFATETPLDHSIKFNVVSDAFRLLGLTAKNKARQMTEFQNRINNRTRKGIKEMREYRNSLKEEADRQRMKIEIAGSGDYQRIYPTENNEKYDEFMKSASDIWLSSISKKKKKTEIPVEEPPCKKKKAPKLTFSKLVIPIDKFSATKRSLSTTERPPKLNGNYVKQKVFMFDELLDSNS